MNKRYKPQIWSRDDPEETYVYYYSCKLEGKTLNVNNKAKQLYIYIYILANKR